MVVNRNSIPQDPHGACYTAGIRLGTPALTTLGLSAGDFDEIADIITTALRATQPGRTATGAASKAKYQLTPSVAASCAARCTDLLDHHPLYPEVALTT